MSCLAIIPARSGSKGIPDKNIRPFRGIPLVVRCIQSALKSKTVGKVVVSTDSPSYARICEEAGAEVVMRPLDLSGDTATSESALLYTLEEYLKNGMALPDWLVFLQCTSPFTSPDDIDSLVNLVASTHADTGFTTIRSHRFLWREDENLGAIGVNHDKSIRLRRQDREPEFMENGAVYVMRTAGFLEHKHRFFGKTVIHEVPEHHAYEIDSLADWEIAEAIYQKFESSEPSLLLPEHPALIVFDFDGVFTDNKVIVSEDGKESVVCDRGDGMAISWLPQAGIPALILSKERNPVVEARARKVKVPFMQAVDAKADFLREHCAREGIDLRDVIYLGNDVNDLECFAIVGCSVAVADSVPEVLSAAHIVLKKSGGHGAIRELIDLVLQRNNTQ